MKKNKKRKGHDARNEQLWRRILVVVACVAFGAFILGLGPVWLSAEATRAAQQSELLQNKISAMRSLSDELKLQRIALMNSPRIEKIATKELGMVPAGDDAMIVALSSVEAADAASQVAEAVPAPAAATPSAIAHTLAQLTAGEASTLLVGDVGLASLR